ncbi:MAG TPA: tetratricopeptide repeat protein [Thermoanaerobaculia bacterium]|nr:tetratricopeptide repeat protein [Thermoanaerobaculia bacterium]
MDRPGADAPADAGRSGAYAPAPGRPAGVAELERLLADPRVREKIAAIAREEAAPEEESAPTRWQRFSAFVAGASSALVVVLAFLVPSIEEQWDRFQARRVVQKHVDLGRAFVAEGKYKLAEESFGRAFELSENKRLDVDEERLEAKVRAVDSDPDWGAANPEGLEESDFLYLLKLQEGAGHVPERAATLNGYGTFLASAKRWREAEERLREAARLDPRSPAPLVGLGNLLRDRGRAPEAESFYRRALRLDGRNGWIHYDLALLLGETGRPADATAELERAAACDPSEPELLRALAEQLERTSRKEEARAVRGRLLALDPPGGEEGRRAGARG